MRNYEGWLLATDVDHTLVTYEPKAGERYFAGGLSEADLDAIEAFMRGGGLFTVATGRVPRDFGELPQYLHPNTWAVACNGAALVDWESGEAVEGDPVGAALLDVVDFFRETFPFFSHFQLTDARLSLREWQKGRGAWEDRVAAAEFPLYKAIFVHPPAETQTLLDAARERFGGRFAFCRSAPHLIECQKAGTSKATALARLRRRLGDRVHTLVCAGDYENDIEMLRFADIGYAVGNALPSVKAAADRVTVPDRDHALASIIAEIGN